MVVNFTPVPRADYRIGVPGAGLLRELLNSDARIYGGSNVGNGGGVDSEPIAGARLRAVDPPHGAAARLPAAEEALRPPGGAFSSLLGRYGGGQAAFSLWVPRTASSGAAGPELHSGRLSLVRLRSRRCKIHVGEMS